MGKSGKRLVIVLGGLDQIVAFQQLEKVNSVVELGRGKISGKGGGVLSYPVTAEREIQKACFWDERRNREFEKGYRNPCN